MQQWFTEILPGGKVVEVQKLVFTETKGRKKLIKTHALPILPPLRAVSMPRRSATTLTS
jgi:hypothetical protein